MSKPRSQFWLRGTSAPAPDPDTAATEPDPDGPPPGWDGSDPASRLHTQSINIPFNTTRWNGRQAHAWDRHGRPIG